MRWRAAFVVREDQRPHPRRSYWRCIGVEDAAHDCPIRRHVKIVRIPLPGGAGGRGAFEDEAHLSTGGLGPLDGDGLSTLAIRRFDRAHIFALAADDDNAPASEIRVLFGTDTLGHSGDIRLVLDANDQAYNPPDLSHINVGPARHMGLIMGKYGFCVKIIMISMREGGKDCRGHLG
jgi:hypothetical protein